MAKNFLMKRKSVEKQQDHTLDIFIDNSQSVKTLIALVLNNPEIVEVMDRELPRLKDELTSSLKFMDDLSFALKQLKKTNG